MARRRRKKGPMPNHPIDDLLARTGAILDPEDFEEPALTDDFGGCDSHCHRKWVRRGVDGQEITLGRICLIPEGNGIYEVKRRSAGTTKVSYEPATGRISKEEF